MKRSFYIILTVSCLGITACYRSAVGLRGVAGLGEVMTKGGRPVSGPDPLVKVIDVHTYFENSNDEQVTQPGYGMEIAFRGANVLGTVSVPGQMRFFPKIDPKLTFALIMCGSADGMKLLAKGLGQGKYRCVEVTGSGDTAGAVALAERFHVPVMLDVSRSREPWSRWEALFVGHPRVSFVIVALGTPHSPSAAKAVAKYSNAYVDTGFVAFPDSINKGTVEVTKKLAAALQPFAPYPNKVLFASSWPKTLINPSVDAVQAVFKQEHWPAVFYRNANRIYRMGMDESAFEIAASADGGEKKNPPAGK